MNESSLLFPGDLIKDLKSIKGVTILGPGIRRDENTPNQLRITKAGKLQFKAPNIYWISHNPKRYIPKRGDLIVGVVSKKAGDTLKIDIGSAELAALSMLAFEGATKKQKPDLQVGDVVYGKLLNAHKEMEPELVCVDSYFKAGKMGPLSNEGFVFDVELSLVERLLDPENPIIEELGRLCPFDIAIGMNGKVWINGRNVKEVLTLFHCLEAAQNHTDSDIVDLIKQNK